MARISDEQVESIIQHIISSVNDVQTRSEASCIQNHASAARVADENLAVWECSIRELEHRIQEQTFSLRRHRNDTIPINQLPNEILARVLFWTSVEDVNTSTRLETLQRLACVCRQWSYIVTETPTLWGFACSMDPLRSVQLEILKSRNTPLEVSFFIYRGTHISSFSELVLPHSYRWSVLDLYTREWREELETQILGSPMPLLKDLRVMHIYSTDRHINIPEEKLRRLRHLKLTGRVYFEPGVLSGLETLHLEGLADAACPSVSQLITVLRESPTLIQLTLQNVKPAGLVPSNSPLIKLGRLIDLDLTNLPLQLTHDIISIARIPRCRRLTVVVENETPSGKVLDTQTAHLKPVIRSILRRVESSFVELKSGSFGLSTPRSGDDSFSLRLALPSASFMNLRSWLNDTLDSTSPTHSIDLTISTPLNARSQVTGAPFLNKMDQVTSLNLDPGTAHCGAWMDYLSAPFLQSNNTLQWPLPNLNRLIISNPLLSPDRLVQMLRNRYGRSKVKQEGWPEKRPARLEMISLLSMHTIRKEDVDIIEEIVKGSVDMDWDEHVERMEHHKHHKYNLEVDEAYQF